MPSHYDDSVVRVLTVLFFASSYFITDAVFVTSTRRHCSSFLPRAMSAEAKEEGEKLPVSGSFFNEVPSKTDASSYQSQDFNLSINSEFSSLTFDGDDIDMFEQIIQRTNLSPSVSENRAYRSNAASNHVASSIIQTTSTTDSGKQETFVGIGRPLNDLRNPEYDENGYTLYADETTGEKKRVFDALVEYPSVFKMKIVGQDDENETFAQKIVQVVADSCGVELSMVKHSKRTNGKWTSVTVHAPVRSADMLYSLYENVDKDPRVKFKF